MAALTIYVHPSVAHQRVAVRESGMKKESRRRKEKIRPFSTTIKRVGNIASNLTLELAKITLSWYKIKVMPLDYAQGSRRSPVGRLRVRRNEPTKPTYPRSYFILCTESNPPPRYRIPISLSSRSSHARSISRPRFPLSLFSFRIVNISSLQYITQFALYA